jgi:alkaline phosphatase D
MKSVTRGIIALCILAMPTAVMAQKLVSGPMLGYAEMREAAVWFQTDKATWVSVKYRQQGTKAWKRTEFVKAEAAKGYAHKAVLTNLTPGTTYEYQVIIDGKPKTKALTLKTQTDWQYKENPNPPDFRFAFGSCNYINEELYDRHGTPYGGDYQIYGHITEKKPDFMLWLGDNTYFRPADWQSRSGMIARYTHTRQLPELQPLLSLCPHYAIWDDHDYGPNDSERSFPMKETSKEVFFSFWANPLNGIPRLDGIDSWFTWNDAEFFLLDDRWDRSPRQTADGSNAQILSRERIDWLLEGLKFSTAKFKFVAVGTQVLNPARVFENMANYPAEREYLLKRIEDEGIKGVIFLTGDRHASEVSVLELKNGRKIYDITASPLTSSARSNESEPNTLRVKGSYLAQRNFATAEISGPRTDRLLTIRFFDSNGNELFRYEIKSEN